MKTGLVIQIHAKLIRDYGGLDGIRDKGLLESALNRPYATFDGIDLYPDPIDKAAAILESIIINHPFLDGNKRTGYFLMRLTLKKYDLDVKSSKLEKYNFVIEVTESKHTIDSIKEWIKSHLNG